MSQPKISICRIVVYTLSESDVAVIRSRRETKPVNADAVEPGNALPMLVTRVNDNSIDGKVMLNGEDMLWVTNIQEDTWTPGSSAPISPKQGRWSWPPRI